MSSSAEKWNSNPENRDTFTCIVHVHGLEQLRKDGVSCLVAEPLGVGLRVITSQSGQVDAGHGTQQPSSLR